MFLKRNGVYLLYCGGKNMETTSLLKKGLTVVILLLFIGNMIIPSHGQKKQQSSIPSKESWVDIDDNRLEKYTPTQRTIYSINPSDIPNTSIRSDNIYWQWARGAGGILNDWGWDVAMDINGNAYFTGCFADVATFGTITLTSAGDYDVFVAKLNVNGAWQWAKSAGGTGFDWSRSIAVDKEGNSYITGRFTNNATFGDIVLTGQGDFNVFVAKLNANGAWSWAVSGGGSTDEGWAIELDADKNPYVTGHFQGPVSFGNTNLTCEGGDDVFVAKLSTAGTWQWATDSGGNSLDRGQGIAVQPNGNSYITGYFEGLVTFGNISLSSQGNKDVFITKLSPDGIWQWAKSGGGTGKDQGYSIAMDENSILSISGDFDEDTAIFRNTTLTSHGRTDVFVANLNTDGAWRWVTSGGGSGYDDGYGVAMDMDGNTYITGQYQSWIQFGNTTLSSQAGVEVYCAKLDTNGTWQWAISACGTYQDSDWGYSIAVEANGTACITGTFHASVTFGDITITSHGMMDAFITKIYEIYGEYPYADFTWAPPNPRPGNIILFNGSLSYDPDGYITLYEWDWNNDGVYDESHTIPTTTYSWASSGDFIVTLRVTDNSGLKETKEQTVSVINHPPEPPIINGPTNGIVNRTYTFSITIPGDPDGDEMFLKWDWDDGTTTEWLGPYSSGQIISTSHSWVHTGVYAIHAQLKDTYEEQSSWSEPHMMTIKDNQPPSPPTITGTVKGESGVTYLYHFETTDPESDDVFYYIDWGDTTSTGWLGAFPSGFQKIASHSWDTKGDYTIKAKAKDIYGNESDWGELSVTMPCSYNIPFLQFWMKLFEQFPYVFPILRHIMGY
jgi:hypothetical protein